MSYRVYSISGAPRPWRVLLGLVAKQLDFELIVLEASKREHKAPAFLELNPRGRVPVLDNQGFIVRESLAILDYVERLHPERPLFGNTSAERARIWEQVMEADHELSTTTSALLRGYLVEAKSELSDSVRALAEAVHPELRRLASRLDETAFICGSAISAADCVAFPQVRLMARAMERFPPPSPSSAFRLSSKRIRRSRAGWRKSRPCPATRKRFRAIGGRSSRARA